MVIVAIAAAVAAVVVALAAVFCHDILSFICASLRI